MHTTFVLQTKRSMTLWVPPSHCWSPHQSMGLVRRNACTLMKGVSFLVLFSCFVFLCMLHYTSARLLSAILEPCYEGIAEIQGMGKWSEILPWTCRLTTDNSEWNSEAVVWFGASQKSANKYFMDTLSARIMALLGRLLWSGELC